MLDFGTWIRAKVAAASPGPWTWRTGAAIDKETGDKGHDPVVLDAHGNISGGPLIILSGEWEDDSRDRANVSLASLAHSLASLTAQLEERLSAARGQLDHAASYVVADTTPGNDVLYAKALSHNAGDARAVLDACKEFMEKYGND